MREHRIHLAKMPSAAPCWPFGVTLCPAIDDAGLFIGARVRLARFARHGGLALDADGPRVLALLSVAAERAVSDGVFVPIAAASDHWRRGAKALANIRLAQARLPWLTSEVNARNVRDAADLLDGGLTPHALMKALGFDTAALEKFDPDQARVPAGSGPTSGRWTDGSNSGATITPVSSSRQVEPRLPIIPIVDDDPIVPLGEMVIPHDGIVDPLDPANLNRRLSAAELLEIAATLKMIRASDPADQRRLNPHEYKNFPHRDTKAQLPIGGTYKTYYMRLPGADPGDSRIVIDERGPIYFTKNHYRSFYPVDVLKRRN